MAREAIAGAQIMPRKDAAAAVSMAAARLTRCGIETARLDAELLMAAACGVSRATVVAGGAECDGAAAERFQAMVARRARREPLAYIVGRREFYSLELAVRPGVLIPRPETETLVEAALNFVRERPGAGVLDLATGSGAIAIAIARHAPGARIVASDISKVSLEVTAENALRHGCTDRIVLRAGDCWAALEESRAPFDLIVSNPPYVSDQELRTLAPEVRDYEPRAALAGGRDGLDFFRRIAAGLSRWLARGGEVMLEVGAGQAQAVETMMRGAGCAVLERVRDLAGLERVIRARRI
jgi:release factor glutamine methyltransferase